MGNLHGMLLRFSKDERGATALEYGMIAALLSLVVATATTTIGASLVAMFQRIVDMFA
tara:strand:- start:823 stop:996 length:174 start_codon:yes stop_codon:yes gene_type:complete